MDEGHIYEKLKEKKREHPKDKRFCGIGQKSQSCVISFIVWILIVIIVGKMQQILYVYIFKFSAITLYSKIHNPNNGLPPGSLITSKKDSDILESNEESFGTEDEEFNDTKDFKVVRVDKGNGIEDEEDVEIIEISCCPRIRFVIYTIDFSHASNKQQI